MAALGIKVCPFRLLGGIDYGGSHNSSVPGFRVFGSMTGGPVLLLGTITAVILWRYFATKKA